MSELKDLYVNKLGNEYYRLECSADYLAQLTVQGALELDLCSQGKDFDLSHSKEFSDILKKYQLKENDTFLLSSPFPHMAIWQTMRKNSQKTPNYTCEVALEMRLFRYELDDAISNPSRAKDIILVLCDLSREFACEAEKKYGRRFAA